MDKDEIIKVLEKVRDNSDIIKTIVDEIIDIKFLDDYILKLKQKVEMSKILTDEELEEATLKLPIYMYSMVDKLENLGIKDDISDILKNEKYSEQYLQADGTIQDNKNKAELASLHEQIVKKATNRAYKKLSKKIEIADSVYKATKKIMDKRKSERETTQMSSGFDTDKTYESTNKEVDEEVNNYSNYNKNNDVEKVF